MDFQKYGFLLLFSFDAVELFSYLFNKWWQSMGILTEIIEMCPNESVIIIMWYEGLNTHVKGTSVKMQTSLSCRRSENTNWFCDTFWLVGCVLTSHRQPIYCPLRRTWSSVLTPYPPGIEPRAVVWQSITQPLWMELKTPFHVISHILNMRSHVQGFDAARTMSCVTGFLMDWAVYNYGL